jgi:RNase P/RNase MRP subunit p29
MSKVFMNEGSGLNLIFARTIKAMGITADMLQESDTSFHAIVPTLPAYPLDKISLNVVFVKPDNFRREGLEFEVVNWESQHHAILGRSAYAKFMVVPRYAYLKFKMPGNNGTNITVHGSFLGQTTVTKNSRRLVPNLG